MLGIPRHRSIPGLASASQRLRTLAYSALTCTASLATACSNGGQTGDEHHGVLQELRGARQRLAASSDVRNTAADDTWNFAWRFYAEEASPAENAFFSPYSISIAASMLIAGAAGETKAEMQEALSFTGDGEAFHQARNTLAQTLESRNREGTEDVQAQTLRVTNDFWMVPEFRPVQSFLDTLSAYYGASTFLAPFDTDAEAARLAINDKVAEDTEGLIDELLPRGSVDRATFVLTNALYFKARWAQVFPESATSNQPFLAQSGESVEVPMMRTVLNASYGATSEYEAITLSYASNELELVAIMPAAGSFDTFSANLTAEAVAAIAAQLERARLDLSFPKFGIESTVRLQERLQALGMQQAFQPGRADFSGIADGIYISAAFHDAVLSLDEEGTEAAAATAFVGSRVSDPVDPPIPVVFDHPFVFFIHDVETNAALFVGHYANP